MYSIKRLIGRRFEDSEVLEAIKASSFNIVKSGEGVKVSMAGKDYSPQEISAMVLGKLKSDAEAKLGEKITEAVITVPAYFDDSQRQATKDAGKIAGLDVKRIINEPTAAALAYGFDKKKDEKIAVYDLGGGTFDISLLEVSENTVEVKSTNGDTHLGGDDFDQKIVEYIIETFRGENGVDLSQDIMAMQRVRDAAEKAKHELSVTTTTEINQPYIMTDSSGPKHLVMTLSRSKLEELVGGLVQKTFGPVEKAFKDAGWSKSDINEVILVGGMTRMPVIQSKVKEYFGKDPHMGVNPDEVVALGAAVQAGVLQGDVKDVLLLDVTPLTLGIETLGGIRTPLIERNTTIPTSKSQIFSTAADNQTSVEIHVLQGEREMAQDNKTLGRFILDGIPPAPRGMPQIEVSFDIDANGILNVKATDKSTGKQQHITITASTGLSEEEIERMKRDAQEHAEEDKKKKELVDARNLAEHLVFTAEKAIKDAGDKIGDDIKKPIQEKISAVKSAKDGDDIEVIKRSCDELSSVMQKIGEAMASQAQNNNAQTQGSSDSSKKDGTVEGEYEEVKK